VRGRTKLRVWLRAHNVLVMGACWSEGGGGGMSSSERGVDGWVGLQPQHTRCVACEGCDGAASNAHLGGHWAALRVGVSASSVDPQRRRLPGAKARSEGRVINHTAHIHTHTSAGRLPLTWRRVVSPQRSQEQQTTGTRRGLWWAAVERTLCHTHSQSHNLETARGGKSHLGVGWR
jgi:hypothetical protein